MVKNIGSAGSGFGSNLLSLYELAAAIEDAQMFLQETDGDQQKYEILLKEVEDEIEISSSRLNIITNIKEPTEEDLEQMDSISTRKDYLAYRLEWLLFHGEQMKLGYWA